MLQLKKCLHLHRFNNQKGVVHVIPLLILLGGIIAGVYLVKNPQILKSKAYNSPQVDPLLYEQRINDLRTKFKIPENIENEKVQEAVKDDLLKSNIVVNGDIAQGDAQVSVIADCFEGQQTNYDFSEYGAFPPLCLNNEQREKGIQFTISGAESVADFIVPYTLAKESTIEALDLGKNIQEVRDLLQKSGIADRIQVSSISGPNSSFDGYTVTLIRIKELEQDVKENPDETGKLTSEQEQARREYLIALRNLWEKQHNITIGLASTVALTVIDKPLKLVGTLTEPFLRKIPTNITAPVGLFLKGVFANTYTIFRTPPAWSNNIVNKLAKHGISKENITSSLKEIPIPAEGSRGRHAFDARETLKKIRQGQGGVIDPQILATGQEVILSAVSDFEKRTGRSIKISSDLEELLRNNTAYVIDDAVLSGDGFTDGSTFVLNLSTYSSEYGFGHMVHEMIHVSSESIRRGWTIGGGDLRFFNLLYALKELTADQWADLAVKQISPDEFFAARSGYSQVYEKLYLELDNIARNDPTFMDDLLEFGFTLDAGTILKKFDGDHERFLEYFKDRGIEIN